MFKSRSGARQKTVAPSSRQEAEKGSLASHIEDGEQNARYLLTETPTDLATTNVVSIVRVRSSVRLPIEKSAKGQE